MGPPFFSIYIFDLPQHTDFTTYLFADDTTFLLSHQSLDVLIKKANSRNKSVPSGKNTLEEVLEFSNG